MVMIVHRWEHCVVPVPRRQEQRRGAGAYRQEQRLSGGWILDNGQEAGIKVDPGLLPQSNEDECRARAELGLE